MMKLLDSPPHMVVYLLNDVIFKNNSHIVSAFKTLYPLYAVEANPARKEVMRVTLSLLTNHYEEGVDVIHQALQIVSNQIEEAEKPFVDYVYAVDKYGIYWWDAADKSVKYRSDEETEDSLDLFFDNIPRNDFFLDKLKETYIAQQSNTKKQL